MYYALKNENNSITGYTRMNAWSEKDKKYILKHFNKKDINELSLNLNRTPKAIKIQYYKLMKNAQI